MNEVDEFIGLAKKFKARARRRNILMIAATAILISFAWLGYYEWHFPVPYKDGYITILDQESPTSFLRIDKENYAGMVHIYRIDEVDGMKTQRIYMYLQDTLSTKFSSENNGSRRLDYLSYINIHDDFDAWPLGMGGMGEVNIPISEIYYLNAPNKWPRGHHVSELTEADIQKMEPILLWPQN